MSATKRGSTRNPQDFYATPDYAIDSILEKIKLSSVSTCCEPCKGSGAIYDKLPEEKYWCELSEERDYLDSYIPYVDLIITNPPFSLAMEFLEKSLSEAPTVIYLLRLNFLGSSKRVKFWQSNPPSHLYVLSRRPSFTGEGTDATEYAWFVWDRGNLMINPPGIYVLDFPKSSSIDIDALLEDEE